MALSLFFFFGWAACHVTSLFLGQYLAALLPTPVWGSAVLLGGAVVSLLLTNIAAMPLVPIFRSDITRRKSDLVGQIVEIRTGRVDQAFGTGLAEDGGAGLLVEVRCRPGELGRGDQALVIHYDRKTDSYEVEPLEKALKS